MTLKRKPEYKTKYEIPADIYELRKMAKSESLGADVIHPQDSILKRLLQLKTDGPWICGGAALRWYHKRPLDVLTDVDIFCNSEKQWNDLDTWLKNTVANGLSVSRTIFNTDNASTFHVTLESTQNKKSAFAFTHKKEGTITYRLQLIRKQYFETIEDVLKQFDLSCCKIGTDGKNFYFGPGAAADIRTKTMNYEGDLRPASYMRILKYEAYGYRPSPALQQKINEQFSICTDLTGYSNKDEYEVGF